MRDSPLLAQPGELANGIPSPFPHPMPVITNISCYKFAPLTQLKDLRERLVTQCKAWGLKGTILLSTEGINLFVAGVREDIDRLIAELHAVPGLEDLTPKISESDEQPFRRMLVRIKKEIIAFGVDGIEPGSYTSPRIDAQTLKQWLDEGRQVTLFDTRNDYEVKLGTFKGAIPAGIDHFRDFPAAVRQLPAHLKDQPVVTFCTGGIRCEKAAPFMEREGFKHIYQLDGGILKYFEEVGGAHYDGECFVFDQRVGVDPSLHETESTQCFVCQSPLSEAEQNDARYVQGVSCPYCFTTSNEQKQRNIEARHAAIRAFTTPLPGSAPYENHRPLNVPATQDNVTLLDFLCGILAHVPREQWLGEIEQGRFLNEQKERVAWNHIVRAGERYLHVLPQTTEPEVNADIRILHEDEALIVLHKPAPLPMHPCGRFNRNTLQHILHGVYAPQRPRAAHRLDANTTGLVVLARTRHFAGQLQPQFTRGEVQKTYLVRVQGHPGWDHQRCDLPVSDEPGLQGARDVDEEEGRSASTEFSVLARHDDGTALVEARPLTGRTNQIRLHLWELGFPIVGDSIYLPGHQRGDTQTQSLDAPPLCLHAWRLTFKHPLTKEPVSFETDRPVWAGVSK